jgi:surfeit locus 1 family protein
VQRFWLVTLVTVMAVGLTVSLGWWQLGRAETKRRLLAEQSRQAALEPADWATLAVAADGQRLESLWGRPVRLRGRWLAQATVFLDNRPMGGQSGFIVVTPLLADGGHAALLVQRGWVPRRLDHPRAVPELETPEGEVEVLGHLAPPPSRLMQLGEDDAGPIRQNIDRERFAKEWRIPLWPASVQQTAPPQHTRDGFALRRDWTVVAGDPAKHLGYALQWFALAALITALYVWFQLILPRRRARGQQS